MQLKAEYCKYEPLRQEHDKQIVQIAHEAGLRIAPDQWSSLLYGDTVCTLYGCIVDKNVYGVDEQPLCDSVITNDFPLGRLEISIPV